MSIGKTLVATALLGLVTMTARADFQTAVLGGRYIQSAGPRFGAIYVTDEDSRKRIEKYVQEHRKDASVSPVMTAFGWQFEYEYLNAGGVTGVLEAIPLVIGLESGLVVPSGTFLVGVRFANGIEAGFGPNVSGTVRERLDNAGTPEEKVNRYSSATVGMTLAVGMTMRAGEMNFPVNMAAVRNDSGYRVSFLLGWNR